MKIITQLKDQAGFTHNEKAIAGYILKEKNSVLNLSAAALAKETYTSPAAVIRLCKRIGLSGYQEFKIRFSAELEQEKQLISEIDANYPFHKEDGIREIAVCLEKLTGESLHEARSLITSSAEDFEKACLIMMESRRIVIFGVGDAYLAGLAFQARMMRAGFNQFLSSPVYGEQRHLAQTLKSGDCGILLSFSGVTESTLECAEILAKNHVRTICLTSLRHGKLADLCDVVLCLPDKEKKYRRYANFSSHACMEYYLNVLYSFYFTRKTDDITRVRID
jgi:DNA-binding MurR/RpiR family transcriptional regulator